MDVRVGLWRKLSTEELMLLTVVLEKTLESPLDCKEIQPVHPKGDQSWVFIGRTDAEAETPVLWQPHAKSWPIGKDLDAGGGGLAAGGEGDNRGWDGWMSPPTRWAWVWVNSGSWWWTGRPGMLRFMGSQRVGHDWATELNWTEDSIYAHTMLIKTPLLHQSLDPHIFLSFFLSLSLTLFLPDSLERESWLHNPGNISLFPSFTLSSSTPDHQVPVQ